MSDNKFKMLKPHVLEEAEVHAKASKSDRGEGNNHPTVKPTELMRYLVRLATQPGGTVLDPFTGNAYRIAAASWPKC